MVYKVSSQSGLLHRETLSHKNKKQTKIALMSHPQSFSCATHSFQIKSFGISSFNFSSVSRENLVPA